MRTYQSPYYVIHTDLGLDGAREAAVRMTAMAEEYHRRTRGFAGVIRRRLPFYIYSRSEDYLLAGGKPGTAGVYTGNKLMALASRRTGARLWHVVQHEGFHQFVGTVIRGQIPVWVNEGMAEYFGHGIWTGDGYVTGVIPPARLRRIRTMIRKGTLRPFREMLMLDYQMWAFEMSHRNYDQAWSMVHFLVHADDGKYRKRFSDFISDIGRGRPWDAAFVKRFGRDLKSFEKAYSKWWLALPNNPTRHKYASAVVQTLTSFLARAHRNDGRFKDFDEFKANVGQLVAKAPPEQWLPPTLLEAALASAGRLKGAWSLNTTVVRSPKLVFTDADGTILTGEFRAKRARRGRSRKRTWTFTVSVKQTQPKKATQTSQPASRPAG